MEDSEPTLSTAANSCHYEISDIKYHRFIKEPLHENLLFACDNK